MARRIYTTYCIKDPDTGDIVYVGQTRDFENRRAAHLTLRVRPNIGSVNIKTWLFDMLSAGKIPVIETLEECGSKRASLASETAWVARLAAEGRGGSILNKWREHKAALKQGGAAWRAAGRRATPPAAHGRKWTTEANDLLRRLVAAGVPLGRMAEQLERKVGAVRLQIERLGMSVPENAPTPAAPTSAMPPLFVLRLDVRALFNLLASQYARPSPIRV